MDNKSVYDMVRESIDCLSESPTEVEIEEDAKFAPLAQRDPLAAAVILNLATVKVLTQAAPPAIVEELLLAAGAYAEEYAAQYVDAESARG